MEKVIRYNCQRKKETALVSDSNQIGVLYVKILGSQDFIKNDTVSWIFYISSLGIGISSNLEFSRSL